MIKPGDKVHVEFDVDSVDRYGYATVSRGGSSVNIHIIDGQSESIIKSWTPVREPQVGDVYHSLALNYKYQVVYVEGNVAILKKEGILRDNAFVRTFEVLNDHERFLLV